MDSRVAYAVVKDDLEAPRVLVAENEAVISRLVALRVVAATPGREVRDEAALTRIRAALLREEWATAVTEWMDVAGVVVDVYPDEEVWTEDDLDEEVASLEIRVAPIFED